MLLFFFSGYGRNKRSFDYNNNETKEETADQIYLLKILELLSSYTEDVSHQKNCLLHQVCNWAATKPISRIKWLNNLKFLEK